MIIGVMCAYEEAAVVGEALASLRAAGCERLVVVDGAWRHFERYGDGPGSTDGTQEMARLQGAEVIEAPARGWVDQVTARNAYLVGEPGDWYVILDADERMAGVLPGTLDVAPECAYLVTIRTAGEPAVRRIRVVREDGTLRYQYAHYGLYRQGHLVDQAALLDAVEVLHVGRPGDHERERRKSAWYALASGAERTWVEFGRLPELAVEVSEMERIAYRYVGGGAWIPGVPARDLRESDAALYGVELASNLASERPLWVAEASDSADELDGVETSDMADELDETPAPRAARGRKSKPQAAAEHNDEESE